MKSFTLIFLFLLNAAFFSTHVMAQSDDPEEQFDSALKSLVNIIDHENGNPYWGRLELRGDDGNTSDFELKAYMEYYEYGDHENYLQLNNSKVFVRSVRNFRYYFEFFVRIPFSKIHSVREVNSSEFYIVTKGDDIEVNQEYVRYRDEELVATTMNSSNHFQNRIKIKIPSWQPEHDEVKDLFKFIAQYNQQRGQTNYLQEMWEDSWR